MKTEYDVIIIGGGATGAGTARDCALRGLKVLLLERYDYTTGATSRNHGLLHSGARYAVNDPESAEECIKENMVLRHIASHCVEETSGLFISLPEDDLSYQKTFIDSCLRAGINAQAISPQEALRREPAANPSLIGAVTVPDGAVDPFRLTVANILDARMHGAHTLVFHEVTKMIFDQNRIVGVTTYNHKTKQFESFYGKLIVNACGIWGHHIGQLAGVTINMFPAKGSLLIFGHRVNNVVLNRCRKPADADILVPGSTICLIGTTSTHVPYDEIDNTHVTPDEVKLLLQEGIKLSPALASTRILRAYSGVRPLVAADNDPSGRSISRGIVLLDHENRDGVPGFITITGGKLMTYRLMAEWATDLVCQKLNINKLCETAEKELPGSKAVPESVNRNNKTIAFKSGVERHGELVEKIATDSPLDKSVVCECENVTVGEINYALKELDVDSLVALRRRTRLGMGTCQGELCACRAAGLLGKAHNCSDKAKDDLVVFLNERWKGMYPIGWGDCLRESQFSSWLYSCVCGLAMNNKNEVNV